MVKLDSSGISCWIRWAKHNISTCPILVESGSINPIIGGSFISSRFFFQIKNIQATSSTTVHSFFFNIYILTFRMWINIESQKKYFVIKKECLYSYQITQFLKKWTFSLSKKEHKQDLEMNETSAFTDIPIVLVI